MRVKEESEKAGLKLNIQKTKIMAYSSITSWLIDREKVGATTDFILGCSKITADSNCSLEMRTCLLLGRKAMTNQDSILKSRDITLLTKVHITKTIVVPIVMYGCDIWTIKKAKHWRIDAFELWCWRRLFRVTWTMRRSNQSILKEINLEYSLEGLMLMRRALILWQPDEKSWLTGKDPDVGKDWGQEEKGTTDEMVGWHHWFSGHEFEQTQKDSGGQRQLACYSPWGRKESDMTWWLNNNKTKSYVWFHIFK